MSSRFRLVSLGLAVVVLVGSLLGCDILIPWLDGEDQQTLQRCTPVASTQGPVGEWKHLGLSGKAIGEISTIAVNPCDPRVVFAGASADFSSGIPGQIFKSTDGGATWDPLLTGSTEGGGILEIEIDPYHPDTVYALAGAAVLKSTDGGRTWQNTSGDRFRNLDRRPTALELDPRDPETLYLGTVNFGLSGSLLKSTNGGKSWNEVGEDVPRLEGISSLAVNPKTEVVYAGVSTGGDVFRSPDGGQSWTLTGLRKTFSYIEDISISPFAENRVYAGLRRPPGALFSSADSGKTWRSEALPDSVGRVVGTAFHPEEKGVYAGTDEGVFYRPSRNASWSLVNEGLPHRSVQTFVRAPGGRDLYLGLANEDGEDGIYVRQIEK